MKTGQLQDGRPPEVNQTPGGAVREYIYIKEDGAKRYPNDIERYIEHKSPLIEKIYEQNSVDVFDAVEKG